MKKIINPSHSDIEKIITCEDNGSLIEELVSSKYKLPKSERLTRELIYTGIHYRIVLKHGVLKHGGDGCRNFDFSLEGQPWERSHCISKRFRCLGIRADLLHGHGMIFQRKL